jgi:hypothetical protein
MVVAGKAAVPVNASAVTIMGRSISPKAAFVGLAILGLAGIAFLYAFDPRNPGVIPACPFLSLTGCFCPGCGTLRALHMLLRGDVASALGYNVVTVLSLPFIAYSLGTGAMRAFGLKAPRPAFVHPGCIWALLAAIVAFWVLRNVPISPLTILAP